MSKLFEDKSRPLYGSAVPLRLGRLEDADIAPYVSGRFRETGRDAGEAVQPLLNAARGHPQRVIHLAHRLWEEVAPGDAATFEQWEAAHDAALQELRHEFTASWRGLGTAEQKTLRAIIAGDGSPMRASVLRQLEIEKSTLFYALQRLADTAEIESTDKRWAIVDPLFEEWIRRLQAPAA